MKNAFTPAIAGLVLIIAVLGCSRINPFAEQSNTNTATGNKTLTDKAVDTAVGEGKIGIPECDEVLAMLTEYAKNDEDNFVTKAVKQTFINRIKEGIKQSIEENKGDKAEIAKNCREFKVQLDKYKAEEAQKKK